MGLPNLSDGGWDTPLGNNLKERLGPRSGPWPISGFRKAAWFPRWSVAIFAFSGFAKMEMASSEKQSTFFDKYRRPPMPDPSERPASNKGSSSRRARTAEPAAKKMDPKMEPLAVTAATPTI